MKSNYSKYSDDELFQLMKSSEKKKSEAGFSELYSRYSQRIYAYCLRVTGYPEDANDIFQEAFTKFFYNAKKNDDIQNIPAFILVITRNLCLNYRRDKKVNVNFEDFNFSTHDEGYEQKELLELIAKSLELLDFEYKEAFILRQYQGMSYKEISEITSVSISAAKNRFWRAKEKIKKILTPYLDDIEKMK